MLKAAPLLGLSHKSSQRDWAESSTSSLNHTQMLTGCFPLHTVFTPTSCSQLSPCLPYAGVLSEKKRHWTFSGIPLPLTSLSKHLHPFHISLFPVVASTPEMCTWWQSGMIAPLNHTSCYNFLPWLWRKIRDSPFIYTVIAIVGISLCICSLWKPYHCAGEGNDC